MIQLTDRDGRLISVTVIYGAPGDTREAEQSVLKMLLAAPPELFNTLPVIFPHPLP